MTLLEAWDAASPAERAEIMVRVFELPLAGPEWKAVEVHPRNPFRVETAGMFRLPPLDLNPYVRTT
jgi:hypothetical protein